MNKKALTTHMLGKMIIILLALAVLAWILYEYVVKPLMQVKLGP